ncbi:MAG: Card1-like endonuclease domain-containing protein [Alkaliphilus sp.]
MKILVSLVSGQTLQNIIFIKQMIKNEVQISDYIFVTTEKMEKEKKVEHTINACGIEKSKVKRILVEEDKIEGIYKRLELELKVKDTDYLVNITGGTKTMAIAVYEFFKRGCSDGSSIYYLPMGEQEYRLIYPLRKEHIRIDWELDLLTYTRAHGLTVENEKKVVLARDKEGRAEFFFRKYTEQGFDVSIIKNIKEKSRRNNKFVKLDVKEKFLYETERQEVSKFISDFGIELEQQGHLSKYEAEYISSSWFEEFVYFKIKKLLMLRDDQIWIGAQVIGEKGAKNEIDVMFVYNNRLGIVECKTDLGDEEGTIISDSLYKLQAIKKRFGAQCRSFLCYTSSLRKGNDASLGIKDRYANRASSMGIELVDRELLRKEEELKKIFS